MKAYEYLVKCPSFSLIARKFPDFVEFSKSVEAILWQEEFGVGDYNPEVIDQIEFLEKLLDMGAISQEEFNPNLQEVSIFCKVEMNCERLDKVLILDYTNRCPDNQGPRAGTVRS